MHHLAWSCKDGLVLPFPSPLTPGSGPWSPDWPVRYSSHAPSRMTTRPRSSLSPRQARTVVGTTRTYT